MSKTFIKLIIAISGIFLVAFSFVYTIRYVANSGVSDDTERPTITLGGGSGGSAVQARNPAQSTDFADIGGNVYVSDERQLGEGAGFSMTYFAEDNSFAIDISGKPVATYRQRASAQLLKTLEISEPEACQLRVYLGVSYDADPSLSGKNLGLSFCPGSVEL